MATHWTQVRRFAQAKLAIPLSRGYTASPRFPCGFRSRGRVGRLRQRPLGNHRLTPASLLTLPVAPLTMLRMIPVTRELLIARLRGTLEARSEILEAYLFGSSARGAPRPESDVDVAVYADLELVPNSPFGYAAQIATDLAGAAHPRRIDVVVLNQAPPLLYYRVLRDGIRLFARQLVATTTREGRAVSRYCDYLPVLQEIERVHGTRIARGEFGR